MSKLHDKYLELKKADSLKMYLFPCGMFYIFLSDDAYKINEYVDLKITYFAKEVKKCGFPKNSLERYLNIFQSHGLDVVVIKSNLSSKEDIIKILQNINLEQTTPIEALNILAKLKEITKE